MDDEALTDGIFPALKMGALLGAGAGPREDQRPAAYIVIALSARGPAEAPRDVGAAAMTILLGAAALGLGACWIRTIDRPVLTGLLGLPPEVKIDSVIALGRPAEAPLVEAAEAGRTDYWRDEEGLLHVPKRPFAEVAFLNGYGRAWD